MLIEDLMKERSEVEIQLGSDGDLLCPLCQGNYLHHTEIQVFSRSQEDAIGGQFIGISHDRTVIEGNSSMQANPSTRRDGLRIFFYCENCPETRRESPLILTIAQHKGQTYLAWLFSPFRAGEV